jgi:protein O-GlcNAc transferase
LSALSALAALKPATPLQQGIAAMREGDNAAGAARFHACAVADPADYEARYWLYSALVASGEMDLALPVLDEARNLHAHIVMQLAGVDLARFRDDKAYCRDVGLQLYAANLMASAGVCLGRSLDFDNLDAQAMLSYGLTMQHQGRMDEAIGIFTAAAEVFQDSSVHQFLLYPLFHAPDRLKRVSEEAKTWSRLYAEPLTPPAPVFVNRRSAKRALRIGYIGPSFTRNQVAQFIRPVLEAHDPEAVHVYLYCGDPGAEAALPKLCKLRKIGGMADAAVAEMIRADKIDILVDVWGHTAGSRLPVLALRPAPIQVAWINFVQTTGLACMDYVLHADSMAYPGNEQYFTEEIRHIGPIVTPYRVAADRPPLAPTPALKNGYVTFGSFNNPAKLSEATVAAWARILAQRPADRLVLKYSYFDDPVLQRVTQARFAAYGAEPGQLVFRGHSKGQDYWAAFHEIDLALDPSPCPGGTTSCDALANGVPVLTQWGGDFYARIGVPVVQPCGLDELIADDWDDYVARALALTSDHEALDALRVRTRDGFDASPYRDEVGFTRRLEAEFRAMFGRWLMASA